MRYTKDVLAFKTCKENEITFFFENPTTFENRFTEILIIAKVMKTSCGLGAHPIDWT